MNVKYFQPNTLWWVDLTILLNSCLFLYQQYSNNYYIMLSNKVHYFYYLLTLTNVNSFIFYVLDITTVKDKLPKVFTTHQSYFFDFQVTTLTPIHNSIVSISQVNQGSAWLERENKELNKVNYTNLLDSRKLLLNYNYNLNVYYTSFNQIINDNYL